MGSGRSSFSNPAAKPLTLGRTPTLGLWSPITPPGEGDDDDDDNMLPNFGDDAPAASAAIVDANPTPTPSSPTDSKPETDAMTTAAISLQRPPPSPRGSIDEEKPASVPQLGLGLEGSGAPQHSCRRW